MAPANEVVEVDDPPETGAAPPARKPLGEMLLEAGFVNERQLRDALREHEKTGQRIGEIVVGHGWASEEDVGRLLAEQWGLSYVDRASIWFDSAALARLSREEAQRLEALPTRIEEGRVVVAVAEPTEEQIDELRRVIGEDPVLVVVPRTALEAGLHSDLLSSGGGTAAPPRTNGSTKSAPDFEELMTEVAENVPDPPTLTAVPPPLPEELRVMDGVTTEIPQGGDIAALAAQARGVADLLAAQASAMRDEAATYTKRIEQLESELAARQQAIADVRQHLEAAVRLLAD
jgi:Type II secretion system (T2SS), protein E, N-terminal domain